MTADITLPKNWKPIGCTKDGSNGINRGANLNAFSGTFDGGNHLLTVPAGERPLFAYVNGTALTVTVEKTVAAAKIEVFEYLKLKEAAGEESGQSMWLVLVSGKPVNGSVYAFDGNAMFTSEKYDGAYCYLMISGKTAQEVQTEAAAKVSQKAGSASAISCEGDVNGTKNVDINDAQLVYDMYRAKYGEFTQTVAVENFLRADMDGSRNVAVKDAAEIVAKIHAEFPVE